MADASGAIQLGWLDHSRRGFQGPAIAPRYGGGANEYGLLPRNGAATRPAKIFTAALAISKGKRPLSTPPGSAGDPGRGRPAEWREREALARRNCSAARRRPRTAAALQHHQRRRDRAAVHAARLGRAGRRRRRADRRRPPRRPARRLEAIPRTRPGPWADFDPLRDVGFPGRAAVHARRPPDRLPHAALDDAHVRRLRRGRGHQPALQAAARRRPDRASRSPTTCPRSTATTRTIPRRTGEFGTCGVAVSSLADMEVLLDGHPAGPRLHLDDHQLAGRADLGDVHRGRREARLPAGRAGGHAPERHPQGVRGAEGVPLPARAVDAPGDRHDRVRDARDAALEHHLHQRLPHPRGRLDGRPGARLHHRRRHGLRGGGAAGAACASTSSRRGSRSSSTATATSSRRSPSSGPRGASGGS